uniref:Uncharacterized protein n=1 Tax=Pseudomonas fluorescens (strain SBW25) TaxID=216595 RepID=A0A0G4E5E4_PSEFS|nr:hypothetical protein PQBR57_0285 [Pseudomonas fluorescens SBW25]
MGVVEAGQEEGSLQVAYLQRYPVAAAVAQQREDKLKSIQRNGIASS